MKLSNLLDALPDKRTLGSADPEVTVLCYDSRSVHEGALFVAVPGLNVDGHDFIPQAVDKGASVVVAQEDRYRSGASWVASLPPSMPVALVPDSRRALALIAAAFYGHPARRLKVVGITGTDGKTTTTFLTSALLEAGGHKTGFMSTVAIKVGSDTWHNESGQTTQEAPEVQELLARMSAADVGYAVVETSSHALALDRVTGCEYDVAVVTNVSSDHLDFHGTQEEYLRAKARLFRMVGESMDKGVPKVSVLNADDKSYGYLAKDACGRVITYGIQNQAQVMAKNLVCQGLSSRFTLVAPEGQASVSLPMPGEYNVYNCLAAVSVALSQGVSMKAIKERLEAGVVVPGRMERVDVGQPFNVLVDFAHAPSSLRVALETLRPVTKGRLTVVFGCAGERDPGRRHGMGLVAGQHADYSILTVDDPRSEAPDAIIDAIVTGMSEAEREEGRDFLRIVDRREAIKCALERAAPGDTVLLAGMGPERWLTLKDGKIPWNEKLLAEELLTEILQGRVRD